MASKSKANAASLKDFEAVFPSLIEDLSKHCEQYGLPSTALKWFQNVRAIPPPDPPFRLTQSF